MRYTIVLLLSSFIIFYSCNNKNNYVYEVDQNENVIEICSNESKLKGLTITIPNGAIQNETKIKISEILGPEWVNLLTLFCKK